MLKRANRLAPAMRKAKQKIEPNWMIFVRITGSIVVGSSLKPHIQASSAGATPNVITSANESSSFPNSLSVCVMRAIRPSIPSKSTANPIAFAAKSRCQGSVALDVMV
jgi:hypothetical protein